MLQIHEGKGAAQALPKKDVDVVGLCWSSQVPFPHLIEFSVWICMALIGID